MFWGHGRKSSQTLGEHARKLHTDSNPDSELSCEAAMLPPAPPCHPKIIIFREIVSNAEQHGYCLECKDIKLGWNRICQGWQVCIISTFTGKNRKAEMLEIYRVIWFHCRGGRSDRFNYNDLLIIFLTDYGVRAYYWKWFLFHYSYSEMISLGFRD